VSEINIYLKKCLWIGMTTTDEIFEQMVAKGYSQAAAHVSQKNLVEGLEFNLGHGIDSLNAFRTPHYPVYDDLFVQRKEWSHAYNTFNVSVGFMNLIYYSHISRSKNLQKEAKKWALKHQKEYVQVFVYSMHTPFMKAAKEIRDVIPNANITLIVPDLPQYMDLRMFWVKKMLKKLDWLTIRSLFPVFNNFVFYTKHMAEYLGIASGKWMVMEGSIDEREAGDLDDGNIPVCYNAIMYSGFVSKEYGIDLLVDAFVSLKELNFELWVTGTGDDVNYVEEAAKKDPRIKFLGFLPSRIDVLRKQRKAAMLVNTRLPTERASAYCFPSKLFEYMMSGRPVLSFRIPGIPEEYFDYLIEMRQVSVEGVAKCIKNVASMSESERAGIGKKGRNFVLKNKNKITQTGRILEFINS
jgi:glycosyltransferase involved in cell wall biosynthesis